MKKWILTPDKYLKPEEAALLRGYLEDKALAALAKKKKKPVRDWAMIDVALSAGLRASEITNLTVQAAHLGKGESALFVKNGKGRLHPVCFECQKKFNSKEEILKQLR